MFGTGWHVAGYDTMKRDIKWWQIIALVILFAGVFLTIWSAQQQDQSMRNDLLVKTNIAKTGISTGQLESLNGSAADIASPEYQALKTQLIKIRAADPSIHFAYLLGQRPDGAIFIYGDSEPVDSVDYSPPGQEYPEVSALFIKAFFEKSELTEGPSSDRWGSFVSAIVPVTDQETGRLVAIFGLDVKADDWNYNIARACATIITAFLLLLVLVVSFGLMQQRHNRREQHRLAASEDKFYRAFHTNPVLMAVSSIEDGRFLEVNTSFLKILGYSRKEVIGKTQLEIGLYSDPAQWDVIRNQIKETGRVRDIDVKVIAKNHDLVNGSFSAITIDVDGLPCLLTVILDITERKKAEEALRESDERFSVLLQHVPSVAVQGYSMDGTTQYWNEASERFYGYTSDEAVGKNLLDLVVPPEMQEEVRKAMTEMAKTEQPIPASELSLMRKDGSRVAVFSSHAIVKRAGGGIELFCIDIDLTERKFAEDTLLRVNQKLNVLSQLTRQDLTTKIFVLNSYIEMAKKQAAGQDQIIASLQKGVQAIQSLHETIEYSKDYQDMGAKPPKWQNVKMTLLLGLSHMPLGKIQHSLETENLEIFADPLLEKVCQRLFENSVKHGDHVMRIRVWNTVTPDEVTIVFEDDGIGIPQELKEQIFLRSEGTRASMRSLIFVREILDITGITIRETGEPGRGARFEMTVPKGAYRSGISETVGTAHAKNEK